MGKIKMNESELKEFISESVKKVIAEMYRINDRPYGNDEVKNEIYHFTFDEIDYLYNEGLVEYDDDSLEDMATGEMVPNYNDLIKDILRSFDSKLSEETKRVLEDYLKGNEDEEIEHVIIAAIQNYVYDGYNN